MDDGNKAVQGESWPAALARRLRAGERIADAQFDQLFTAQTRSVSFRHWTPISVATRAACFLAEGGATEILDVGSGPGKVCLVGALRTGARFTGVEQRQRLVEEAHVAAVELGADRARFVHANLVEFDCSPFDGFYFYNPFQEHIEEDDLWPIDETIQRAPELHRTYVGTVVDALIRAPVGTLVATFHGFGAPMPREYRRLRREQICGGELALWVRGGSSQAPRRRPEGSRPGELHSDEPSAAGPNPNPETKEPSLSGDVEPPLLRSSDGHQG